MGSAILFLALLVLSFAVTSLAIWLGARLVKSPRPSLRRSLLATAILFIISLVLVSVVPSPSQIRSFVVALMPLGLELFLAGLLFHKIFDVSAKRAAILCIFLVAASGILLAITVFGVRPYLFETFATPTNSMSPAILGWHRVAVCAKCGDDAVIPAAAPDSEHDWYARVDSGICTKCRHVGNYPKSNARPVAPDRFSVNKLASPRRWDIVAYRSRARPEVVSLHRIVGLPGETIQVYEGAAWANGAKLAPPPAIAGQTYAPPDRSLGDAFATKVKPLNLGPQEYFLLGDFSQIAADSRFEGPIPRQSILGVADLRYWPPTRIRFLR
jgi:signal peptidase I